MEIIGITGPSGAGKTTALRVLEQMGGQVFDCDAIYHRLLETDRALLEQIEATFPGTVKDSVLDRKALGARVFADPEGLDKLTGLTQPIVARRVLAEIRKSDATSSVSANGADTFPSRGRQFAVIDAIGLFESGLGEKCSLTVAVVADPVVRIKRLMARDSISEDYARARIAAQKPARWYAEQADLVLENNGSEAEFAEQCREVFQKSMQKRRTTMDHPDMCVPCGEGLINLRVGAIIQRNGELLMTGNTRDAYLYSVGGRIKMGETAQEAVVREVLEETGVRMEVDRLVFVHENYFQIDLAPNAGKPVYELCFYYLMQVPADFEPICESRTEDGMTEFLRWVRPDTPIRIYPEFFRTELEHLGPNVKFISTDDRQASLRA